MSLLGCACCVYYDVVGAFIGLWLVSVLGCGCGRVYWAGSQRHHAGVQGVQWTQAGTTG